MSAQKWLGIGCLGVLLFICIGSLVVVQNVRKLGAFAIEKVVEASINDLDLPEEDAAEVRSSIGELTEAYKSGEIDSKELKDFASSIAEDPMLTIGLAVHAIRHEGLRESDLPAPEKAASARTCERFLRGLDEGKISQEDGEDVFDGFEAEMKDIIEQRLRTDELRELIDGLDRIVEERGIPDEPYSVDFGDHVQQQVDQILR